MAKPFPFTGALTMGVSGLAAALLFCAPVETSARRAERQRPAAPPAAAQTTSDQRRLLDRYCVTCHNERLKTGNLTLDQFDVATPGAHPEVWEKVVHKLRTGTMPPPNMPQPSDDDRR